MAVEWGERLRRLLADIAGRAAPSHGYPLRVIEAAEARLGVKLPTLLRDYYLSVGKHKLNRAHNRLLPPDALEVLQGRLVFMVENQCVVCWGVRSRTTAADPVVFQTTDPEDEDEDWVAESPCSQFLPAMLCRQAVSGGLSYIGYSDPLDSTARSLFGQGWSSAGRLRELSAFVRPGQVGCILTEGASVLVHVGCRSSRGFRDLASELGVALHEV